MKLIIMRHAETVANVTNISQGHHDSSLTKKGIQQALQTKEALLRYTVDATFCSDLGRAVSTASLISPQYIIDKRLREVSWGDWSLIPFSQILSLWEHFYEEQIGLGVNPYDIRPPNGENVYDCIARLQAFLDTCIYSKQFNTVLIVSHSGTNKILIGMLLKKSISEFFTIKQSNCCLNIFEIANNAVVSSVLNSTEHLGM